MYENADVEKCCAGAMNPLKKAAEAAMRTPALIMCYAPCPGCAV
jgi:hypothetical protein